uniref:Metallophosphoesterase n=1 Tax=uncultured organism TaxID=155900 RepID=M1P1W0_9ZZZZ|nr:metallophosphoesterase [uncultured organism]
MNNSSIKLLCTADLHLGRHPTRIPEEFDSREFSPISVWEKIVKKAINLGVDAVVITGDIIDKENRFFEAFGPLEAGIKKLEKEEVFLFGVAGNHDVEALKKLNQNIDSEYFNLLGLGGEWESKTISKNNQDVLEIIGWSYPRKSFSLNPLKKLDFEAKDYPTLGLIHSELDNPSSNYAPVSREGLQSLGLTCWILGHIHQSFLINNNFSFILNPGSPLPLNPGEPGEHWVWEVTLNSKSDYKIDKHKLNPLQYLKLNIDISSLENIEKITSFISEKLRNQLKNKDFLIENELILVRLILSGSTRLSRDIEVVKESIIEELELNIKGVKILIEKIINKTELNINLEKYTDQQNQMGLLADYINKIKMGETEKLPQELIEKVEKKMWEVYKANAYKPLRSQNEIEPPSSQEIISILEEEGYNILRTLWKQKED